MNVATDHAELTVDVSSASATHSDVEMHLDSWDGTVTLSKAEAYRIANAIPDYWFEED